MSESNSHSAQNSNEKNVFEEYRKTCSTIFGKTSQSQLKYIQAFSDFQQAVWTSCESLVAKQTTALEEYSKKNPNTSHLELPLRIYGNMIDAYMTWLSAAYDMGVLRMQFYRKTVEYFNDVTSQAFSFNKVRNE